MAALFVSHSSRDRALVEALRDWLIAQGYGALFVDFDPERGIPAGRNWERELYSQLRKADAVLLVLTADAAASRWCFAEVALARSLRKPVVALRTDPAVRMALVSDTQGITFAGDAASFAELGERLASADLGAERSFAWSPQRNPYPGLAAFSADDAAVFFGREQETARLLEMLRPTLQRGPGRFVAIVGPSGSGKSSLLRAGLIPRLQRRPEQWLVLPPLLPGPWPTENLARCLRSALRAAGIDRSLRACMAGLATGSAGLVDLVRELVGPAGERTVLLPVDQAEELVTRAGPEEQRAFLGLISGALAREPDLWVVATLRSEFLSSDVERAGIAGAIDEALLVEPVARYRLPEVILGPAHRAGIEFAPGLVERMALDAGRGDALPLLQVTLETLYAGAGADATITVAEYERVGGVGGALERRADGVLADLTSQGLGAAVVPLLLRLVVVEAGGQATSRRLARSLLSEDEQAVADAFVEARLLTAAVADDGTATIAIAHEALVRSWPVAARAIDESREALQLRSELERHAADWRAGAYDDAYLLRGRRLARYEGFARDGSHELGPLERDYLAASRAHAVEQLAAARRSNRRLRVLVTGLAAAVVLVAVAGAVAIARGREAQRQARLTAAGLLAARADSVVDRQPDLAIALGLQALDLADDGAPPRGLVSGMARVAHATRVVARSTDQVHAVSVTPDGAVLAFAGWDRAVRLVDPASGAAVGEAMTGHRGVIMTMALSADGARIASAGADGGVRLWDVATRRQQGRPLVGHDVMVTGLAFTPDGRRLASADVDGTVLLWDVAARQRVEPALQVGPQAWALAFSPDGGTLAIGREGGIVVWEVGASAADTAVLDVPGVVLGLAFAPDGGALAAGTAEGADRSDGSVRIWRWPSREALAAVPDVHASGVRGVAFSPDGRLLASAGGDGAVQLYDAASLRVYPQSLVGHTNVVKAIMFSPDGREIFSAGWDGTVRAFASAPAYTVRRPLSGVTRTVTDVALGPDGTTVSGDDGGAVVFHDATGRQIGPPLRAHHAAISAVGLSREGGLLATAARDGTVGVWDARRRRRVGEGIDSGFSEVLDVALHPDGRRLAVGGWEGAKVFDLASPAAPPLEIAGHVESVQAVAYSSDGRHLATASGDQRVILHRVDGAGEGRVFRDHRGEVRDVAFSPRGGALASVGEDGTIAVRDVSSGDRRFVVSASPDALLAVAFSRDGARVAAAGAEGTAWVWSATTRREVGHMLSGHHQPITALAFGPGDGALTTAGDGLWRWDLGFDRWTVGCDLANRDLSRREWRDLVPGRPYERACP